MARIDVRPRKSPRQARSQQTVSAILEAAARVLAQESLAGFNTNRVAERAGVSVGSVYQYFPNKAALVTALIDRAQTELADALEALLRRTEGQGLEQALRAVAQWAISQQYGKPMLAAALDHEERRLPVRHVLAPAEARMLASVGMLLDRHRAEIADDLAPAAPSDCMVITKALVEADAMVGRRPAPDLEDRIVRALTGYLLPARAK